MSMANGVIRLHGRQYKTVALRVQEFREKHPIEEGWAIQTQLIHCNAESVIIRATVTDPQGREIAVGYAEEQRTPRGINATSALENCETSALGRALAAAGFAGTEYASADELVNALKRQGQLDQDAPQRGDLTGPAGRSPEGLSTRNPPSGHSPSWTRDHKRFIAELKNRNLDYESTAGFCESHGWGRPANWSTDERNQFLEDLDSGKYRDLYDPETAELEPTFVPDEDDDINHVA